MKQLFSVLILTSLVKFSFSQEKDLYKFSDQENVFNQVEIIDEILYILEDPTNNNTLPGISSFDTLGNHVFYTLDNQIGEKKIVRLLSLVEEDDGFLIIALLEDQFGSDEIGLIKCDSNFSSTELLNSFSILGSHIDIETQDKIWNPLTNNFEWVFAVRVSFSFRVLRELVRVRIENGKFQFDRVRENFDSAVAAHIILDTVRNYYLLSNGRYVYLIDQDFNMLQRIEVNIELNNTIYTPQNVILNSIIKDTLSFLTRDIWTPNQFSLTYVESYLDLENDTIITEQVQLNYLDNESSSYVVFQSQNDFDNSHFIYWSGNIIQSVPDSLKSINLIHLLGKRAIDDLKKISFKNISGYISDAEYYNGKYYGCGSIINSADTKFYFIIDHESDIISSDGTIEFELPDVNIFPNPSNGIINISLPNDFYDHYVIHTTDGQLAIKKTDIRNQVTVQIRLDSGSYIISFYSQKLKTYISKKIIIY